MSPEGARMIEQILRGHAAVVFAASLLLAGCGFGTQTQLPATVGSSMAQVEADGSSWIDPQAKGGSLLYVSDYYANVVHTYTYPALEKAGELTGHFANPDGVCADKIGNVWIVNNSTKGKLGEEAVEYAHGGTNPIGKVSDSGEAAVSCSVDPVTGALAVSNIQSTKGHSGGPGSVVIYAHAKGHGKLYHLPDMPSVYFCGYDDKGNLFVDGINNAHAFALVELRKGATKFKKVALKGGKIHKPGEIRWDGKHLAIGDQSAQKYSNRHATSAIYQVSGDTVVGKTPLTGSEDVVGFWVDGTTVIAPDAALNVVDLYNYPKGGKPTQKIKGPFQTPEGAAISP
jgi:hypothetical protein